ncbi:MAG: hypothetical protein IT285_08805 [Bdellovibrionales bacterium]|nr:hypothetical protein [Bdellovibrionales bacterium]
MIRTAGFLLWGALLFAAEVRAEDPRIPMQGEVILDPAPLTTERAWRLDPGSVNSHRAGWLVEHDADLVGLAAVERRNGGFAVSVNGLIVAARVHLRGLGSRRYLPESRFPCGVSFDERFLTRSGAESAGRRAASLWIKRLDRGRPSLEATIRRLSAPEGLSAEREARRQLRAWVRRQERAWRAEDLPAAARFAWKEMAADAKKTGACRPGAPGPRPLPGWAELMDPRAEKPKPLLLARAPSRRWAGAFSLRATVEIGGLRLNGQFLIDPSSRHNLLSPSFFETQGAGVAQLVGQLGEPETLDWQGEKRAGRTVFADVVEIGGFPTGIDAFVLTETKVFLPPEHLSACCDGVLGQDFLNRYAVEFRPGAEGNHIRIWDRDRFSPPAPGDWYWVETAARGDGWSSLCTIQGKEAQLSWAPVSRFTLAGPGTGKASVACSGLDLAGAAPIDRANAKEWKAGADFLGRGPFVLDFASGRLWFDRKGLERSFVAAPAGIGLAFHFERGERALRVTALSPAGPQARALAQAGLKESMRITEVNGVPAGDLDLWEIGRALRGDRGDVVTLKWSAGKAEKLFPLKLSSRD